MKTTQLRLLTIVTEAVLESRIIELVRSHGATGYTVTESRGEGSRGARSGERPGENLRLECVVGPAVADAILESLSLTYFEQYAVIAWVTDVAVLRSEKYL